MALFRRLFRGRTDVYPIRWESKTTAKSGYSPAFANEWRAGVCEKPRIRCGDGSNRMLIPLSDSVIFDQWWRDADKRAERDIASAYDGVRRALADLSEAYTLCASRADFDRKLAPFMARHGKRGGLVRRLADAGLWKKTEQ